MAYAFIISAVQDKEFLSFKSMLNTIKKPFFRKLILPHLHSERAIVTTHYFLSYGTGNKALDSAMHDLLDTGETIKDFYWHPLRLPFYQDSTTNKKKILRFKNAYENYLASLTGDDLEYFSKDFEPIISILDFVSSNDMGVLTFLEKPQDKERADKVIYPISIEHK